MTVLNDSQFWSDLRSKMEATGWVITDCHRYDPTIILGLTPTGKTFEFTLTRDNVASITIANRNRTRTVPNALLEDGGLTVDEVLNFYYSLPGPWQ